MAFSAEDFGASFKGFLDQMSAAAPSEEPIFRRRLREHFEREPKELPTLTEKFPTYDHANLHTAVESELSGTDCSVETFGVINWESFVQRTGGASPAFIREMMRKAALFAADECSDSVEDRHLDEAIHELVVEAGQLTQSLLGFASRNAQEQQGSQ
jgi:hypothetical protein